MPAPNFPAAIANSLEGELRNKFSEEVIAQNPNDDLVKGRGDPSS